MGLSIDVNSSSFATEVLERSYEKPVLVDFFAQWCGPCQLIKPMLEKLVQEYDFVLAKVDIDQNPDLAQTYGVEGVPDIKIVTQGSVSNGFVGALTEPQLRELLGRLNLKSDLDSGLEAIQAAQATGDINTTKRLFQQLIERFPENRELILAAARFLVDQNSMDSATKLLTAIQPHEKAFFAQAEAIRLLIEFKQVVADPVIETELDAQYIKACEAVLAEDYESALSQFLDIVARDRKYKQDGARKAMLAIFSFLGEAHPLTQSYRRQLMQALF